MTEPDLNVPPAFRPDPALRAQLDELAEWHEEWEQQHLDESEFTARHEGSDYPEHHLDVDGATAEAEAEFGRRANEIMGIGHVERARGNADELEEYWTRGEGLGRWRFHPHPWDTLRDLLDEHDGIRDPEGLASAYFHKVFGYWPGARKGKNPVGNEDHSAD